MSPHNGPFPPPSPAMLAQMNNMLAATAGAKKRGERVAIAAQLAASLLLRYKCFDAITHVGGKSAVSRPGHHILRAAVTLADELIRKIGCMEDAVNLGEALEPSDDDSGLDLAAEEARERG